MKAEIQLAVEKLNERGDKGLTPRNSKRFKLVMSSLINNGSGITPCVPRNRQTNDHTKDVCQGLRSIGVEFELTNNAPMGGKHGNRIRLIIN